MRKLDYIRRQPWMSDYNALVEAINQVIDRLNARVEIENVTIEREVKDFKFFNWEEVKLPYEATYTLLDVHDATEVFDKYVFTYKEMHKINDIIIKWNIVSLTVKVTEEITEKDKQQEAMFETVQSISLDEIETKIEMPKKKTKKKSDTKRKTKK